ncbi:MAG: hypothetical protein ACTSU3_05815 [Candidatus Thorarchaeota archaeon]
MDTDSLSIELKRIFEIVEELLEESKGELERFQVALTGTLRLLDGENTTLLALQGNPTELRGYILQLTTQLSRNSVERFEKILNHLASATKIAPDS